MTSSLVRDGQSVTAVHERLRAAILRGEIEAGASVSQGLLASKFGVGRTPLREALRMLQREGLVISEPNRQVRIALETVAVRITVPTLRSRDLAELEGYLAQMDHYQRSGDEAGFRMPHRAFHHLLVARSGRRVSEQIGELADHSERYRLRFGGLGRGNDRRAEHRAILDAASAHDPEMAARRLAVHHASTAALVLGALDPEHDLGRLLTTIRTVAPGAEDAVSLAARPAARPVRRTRR